jgi:hypothetical protein
MILHAASMAAFFMNLAQLAQCVVQSAHCAIWMQLLVSALPSFLALGIAWFAFWLNSRWNRKQWILDQKKAEWKELLIKIAEIEHEIPILITGLPDHQKLEPIVLSILPPLRSTLFVYSTLESSGFIAKWELFVQYVSDRFMMTTRINQSIQTGTLGDPVFSEDIERWDDKSRKEEIEVRNRLHTLLKELRDLAHKSLEMKFGQP